MQSENISVTIMGREYAFACAPDEKDRLLECVAMVDEKMSAIRDLGKLSAVDRIAVMAALTFADDLLSARSTASARGVSPARHNADQDPLAIASAGSRMQTTDDAITRFLERTRPQLGLGSNGLFD